MYPFEQGQEYAAIQVARFDWEEIADKYRLTHLFVRTEQVALVEAATVAECWHEVYRDQRAMIFVRCL